MKWYFCAYDNHTIDTQTSTQRRRLNPKNTDARINKKKQNPTLLCEAINVIKVSGNT